MPEGDLDVAAYNLANASHIRRFIGHWDTIRTTAMMTAPIVGLSMQCINARAAESAGYLPRLARELGWTSGPCKSIRICLYRHVKTVPKKSGLICICNHTLLHIQIRHTLSLSSSRWRF